jgi:lipoprotein-releasing system ATP-binding protein
MNEKPAAPAPAPAPTREPVLELRGIVRTFAQGSQRLEVLKGASLSLAAGEVAALVGPSGSGKSTLLHIAGLLETPDAGEVVIGGRNCGELSDRERTAIRLKELGFVYQFHHLLPEFTARENVMLPQRISGVSRRKARAQAEELLGRLGMGERLDHRPSRLSGGEQQRVAVARALANHPRILLADEPTGNLDPKTAKLVLDELVSLARAEGVAALVATHNLQLAAKMDRALLLQDGRLLDGRELVR